MSMSEIPIHNVGGQLRQEVIRGLSRRLIGPNRNSEEEISWPGPNQEWKVVGPDFEEANSYPTGPWIGTGNEEVIPYNPFTLYRIGRISPRFSSAAVEEIAVYEDQLRDVADQEIPEVIDVDLLNSGDELNDGDDESVKLEESIELSANSIGISIRIPLEVHSLTIRISGGGYEELSVQKAPRPWWIRRDVHHEIKVSTSNSSKSIFSNGLIHLEIGCEVRSIGSNSRYCTVWVTNTALATSFSEIALQTLFQVTVEIDAIDLLPYEPSVERQLTSLDLLYNDVETFAVGHSCDVKVERQENFYRVKSVTLPIVNIADLTPNPKEDGMGFEIGMMELANLTTGAQQGIDRILATYSQWISARAEEIAQLEEEFQQMATENLNSCRTFLEDIRTGWNLVLENSDIQQCFRDASRAMALQQIGSNAPKREVTMSETGEVFVGGVNPHQETNYPGTWRPFQIAFILSSLLKVTDEHHFSRESVDVIWMPTGGGKTEAYLGLAAFTILWEKLHQVRAGRSGRNTKVYMRYTLRLLTVQQIQRASSLICALETLREANVASYGSDEIRIGAWVGKVTPNSWKEAERQYRKALKDEDSLPFLLKQCPWCGAEIGKIFDTPGIPNSRRSALGYSLEPIPNQGTSKRLFVSCCDPSCFFKRRTITFGGQEVPRGLPVHEVDEDVYRFGIDFVVGTLDKVARMSWVTESRNILRRKLSGNQLGDPPALFIQDELHLVSGPLGSVDGVFEAMLEGLCNRAGGRKPVIVAATATTKNYESQIHNLYARSSRVVPPPGLSVDDSFFAKRDESPESLGKTYLGICHSGYVSGAQMQVDVIAALAHFAPALKEAGLDPDPYWTNVSFFSSRRALGVLTSAVETTLRSQINLMASLTGTYSGTHGEDGKQFKARGMWQLRELTATASEDVGKVLDDLSIAHPDSRAIDLCFATSMVEVGLDVSRLGLMTVMGQPKSASQYIQVTGRVGRNKAAPGLVITVLNPNVARDRAHYEGFTMWHKRLYASVESASVTPFTGRALQKSIPSVMSAMSRILGTGSSPQAQIFDAWDEASAILLQRAEIYGEDAVQRLMEILENLKVKASRPEVARMKWTREEKGSQSPFVFPMGQIPAVSDGNAHWEALMSLRNVDQDANFKVLPESVVVGQGDLPGSEHIEI